MAELIPPRFNCKESSVLELGNEPAKALDPAAPAHPRVNEIAPRANAVIAGLQVKPTVEIERRTLASEARPHRLAPRQDEIDMLGARQQSAADRAGVDAFVALALDPVEALDQRPGAHRHAQQELLLDDQPPDLRLRLF